MTRQLETITAEEAIRIHEILVADFAQSGDRISPPGVRSLDLLESAVHRQHAGHGKTLKYPTAVWNAATLVFGICCDHPFHNGNKRSALVAMLAHLDRNGLYLQASQSELYQFMIAMADHTIGQRPDPRKKDKALPRRSADEEVAAIAEWLEKRVQPVKRGERPITYRQLRQNLAAFGCELGEIASNRIEVLKVEQQTTGLLRRTIRTVKRRVGWIGHRNEGTEVSIKDLKDLRRMCKLCEEDGVDADAFYNHTAVIDAFVNRYRRVLRRLAKT
jgi:death-on-curing family protein